MVGRLLVLTTAAALLAAAPADARSIGRCRLPRRAVVEAQTKHVVVYSVTRLDRWQMGSTRVHACIRRSGERLLLRTDDHVDVYEERSTNYMLAGHYVAWSYSAWDHYGGQYQHVQVYDLRRKKAVRYAFAGGRDPYEEGPDTIVESLALTPHGGVAWTVRTYVYPTYGSQDPLVEHVYVDGLDSFGRFGLDSDPGVDVRSLRTRGEVASWTNRGNLRTARLRQAGPGHHCSLPARAQVRARGRASVVYHVDAGPKGARRRTVVGCLFRSGRRTVLAHVSGHRRHVVQAHVAGRFAALVTIHDLVGGGQRLVAHAFDLDRGVRKWACDVGHSDGAARGRIRFEVLRFLLAGTGSFVYGLVARDHGHLDSRGQPTETWSVGARWPGGSGTVDTGQGVAPWSLELHGLRASWTHDKQRRSLTLR